MTEQETIVMQKLIESWNEFIKLEPKHKDEVTDFRFHLHALQKIVLVRPMIYQGNNLPDFKNPPPCPPQREFANINTSKDVTFPSDRIEKHGT